MEIKETRIDPSKANKIAVFAYDDGLGHVVIESQKTNKAIIITKEGKSKEYALRKMEDSFDKSVKDRDLELNPSLHPLHAHELGKLPAYAQGKAATFIDRQYSSYEETQKANTEYQARHTKK